jgi:NADH dehydrogenase FAD-containing subunit
MDELKRCNISVRNNCRIKNITAEYVELESGEKVYCNQPIWATGAEPQEVTTHSDLEILNGYFRVNDFMQSTSHPNVFAGGDCVTMETYAAERPIFPPKAGVYAVREGPFIAQNIARFIKGKEMLKYVPQRSFLSLLMTGDGSAIGTKYGITFKGKWVWKMKDYIDQSFMDLFDANLLFEDYKNKGMAVPLEHNVLFDDEAAEEAKRLAPIKDMVAKLTPEEAGKLFACDPEETEFRSRFMLVQRMNADPAFADEAVKYFKPSYY